MAKAVTLIAFLAALFYSACAQQTFSARGTVQDRTGAAIAGAEVHFHSNHFNTTIRTGRDGSFVIGNIRDTRGTITVSAAGFATVDQEWSSGATAESLSFVLQPAGASEQIVVSATRTQMKLSDLPGSAVSLSAEDLQA